MNRGKVLINGAGGFLGRHTVEVFLEAGYDVRATDLPGMPLDWAEPLGAEAMHADLSDFAEACRVTEGVRGVVNVAGVFHFSATYEDLYRGNVQVTENMCRASLEAGVEKFVHIATVGVYGLPAYTPMDEDGPKNPRGPYEVTKKLGEDKVWEYQQLRGLPAAILRPGPIYGARGKYIYCDVFASTILMGRAEKPWCLAVKDSVFCHHVHARDVARASELLLQLPRTIGNAYNCADRAPMKWNDFFALSNELTGYPPNYKIPYIEPVMKGALRVLPRVFPQKILDRINDSIREAWEGVIADDGLDPAICPQIERDLFHYLLGDHIYDTSKLEALGFECEFPRFGDGLRQTHQWMVDQKWIPARA